MKKLKKIIFILPFVISFIPLSCNASNHLNNIYFNDFQFWRMMDGYWEAKNTYFDSDMNYIIRSYSSLIIIKLHKKNYSETEYRFYPYGIAATRYGKGLVKEGEGIEIEVNYSGKLIDDNGTMGNIHADHGGVSMGNGVKYEILGGNEALRSNKKAGNTIDSYRLYTTFISPNYRLRSNFGLYYKSLDEKPGSMRAFILSQDQRIKSEDFNIRRNNLRKKFNIKVVSVADLNNEGQSHVYRLDEVN